MKVFLIVFLFSSLGYGQAREIKNENVEGAVDIVCPDPIASSVALNSRTKNPRQQGTGSGKDGHVFNDSIKERDIASFDTPVIARILGAPCGRVGF